MSVQGREVGNPEAPNGLLPLVRQVRSFSTLDVAEKNADMGPVHEWFGATGHRIGGQHASKPLGSLRGCKVRRCEEVSRAVFFNEVAVDKERLLCVGLVERKLLLCNPDCAQDVGLPGTVLCELAALRDRKSTRLNSS